METGVVSHMGSMASRPGQHECLQTKKKHMLYNYFFICLHSFSLVIVLLIYMSSEYCNVAVWGAENSDTSGFRGTESGTI